MPAGQSILMSPGEMIRTLRKLKEWSQLDMAREKGYSIGLCRSSANKHIDS